VIGLEMSELKSEIAKEKVLKGVEGNDRCGRVFLNQDSVIHSLDDV